MAIAEFASQQSIRIPPTAHSLVGFRRWAKSPAFPERGHICFIAGEILIDMSPEELETHNQVKGEIDGTLRALAKKHDLGRFYSDRALVTNVEADLSTEPDGTFVAWESLESGQVRQVPRRGVVGQYMEIKGSPDMVLEVVSASSVRKDTLVLKNAYHRAGVREYWLVDARAKDLRFRMFTYQSSGYVAVPCRGGWLLSEVFDCRFRLKRHRDRMNFWTYTLEMRPK